MSERDIQVFVQLTHASEDVAAEYISANGGDVQEAIEAYFSRSNSQSGPPSSSIPAQPSQQHGAGPQSAMIGSSHGPQAPASGSASRFGGSSANSRSGRGARMATFADLQRRQDSQSPDNDRPDNLFTGGEKSGLAVQNPGQGGDSGGSRGTGLVGDIINKARQAQPDDSDDSDEPTQSAYVGTGFRLGRETEASEQIEGAARPSAAQERVHRTLTFWKDGFSVDDGELFRYDDPKNVQYLQAIHSGRAPLDVLDVEPNQLVDVRIDQRVEEEYMPPKRAPGFDGAGARLGTSAPSVTVSREQSPAPVAAPATTSSAARPSAPTSSGEGDSVVQIRLADGSVHRRRVESSGPVQQLYDYVDSVASSDKSYILQTTFPMRPLSDREQTVSSAGLKGATVVQRWA